MFKFNLMGICEFIPGFITLIRALDAESAPFSGGYWLEIYAEEEEPPIGAAFATDGTPPRYAVAEVFIQVSVSLHSHGSRLLTIGKLSFLTLKG